MRWDTHKNWLVLWYDMLMVVNDADGFLMMSYCFCLSCLNLDEEETRNEMSGGRDGEREGINDRGKVRH